MHTFNTRHRAKANTPRWLTTGAMFGLFSMSVAAQPVKCHLEYAGVQRPITIMPTACPAQVLPQVEGASLVFKVVNATAPAQVRGVTIETQTLQNGTLQTAHQAQYMAWEAAPTAEGMPYGFTGLQTIPNPDTAQNLRYWCERLASTPPLQEETCPDISP